MKKSKISFYIGEGSMNMFLTKFVDHVQPRGLQLFDVNWYEPVEKWSCTLLYPGNPDTTSRIFRVKVPLNQDIIHHLTHDLIGPCFRDLMNELGIEIVGGIKVTITKTKTY